MDYADQILVQWSSWPEDEKALKLMFPAAPAWGQAGSQGVRNVTTPLPSCSEADNPEKNMKRAQGENKDARSRSPEARPRREAKPNRRYHGPEWVAQKERTVANLSAANVN